MIDFFQRFYILNLSKATHAANTRELMEEQRKPIRTMRKSPSKDTIKYSLGGTFLHSSGFFAKASNHTSDEWTEAHELFRVFFIFMETKELLRNLELELLEYDTRHNLDRIDALLADDFFECGKHGDRFGKKECLESLPKETKEKIFEASDIEVIILSESIGQVRYIGTIQNPGESPTTSFRTSLWRKTESGWQMFFHQGTLIQ